MAQEQPPLPPWLSYTTLTDPDTGSTSVGVVELPLTYSGPSIPLAWPWVAASDSEGGERVSLLGGTGFETIGGEATTTSTGSGDTLLATSTSEAATGNVQAAPAAAAIPGAASGQAQPAPTATPQGTIAEASAAPSPAPTAAGSNDQSSGTNAGSANGATNPNVDQSDAGAPAANDAGDGDRGVADNGAGSNAPAGGSSAGGVSNAGAGSNVGGGSSAAGASNVGTIAGASPSAAPSPSIISITSTFTSPQANGGSTIGTTIIPAIVSNLPNGGGLTTIPATVSTLPNGSQTTVPIASSVIVTTGTNGLPTTIPAVVSTLPNGQTTTLPGLVTTGSNGLPTTIPATISTLPNGGLTTLPLPLPTSTTTTVPASTPQFLSNASALSKAQIAGIVLGSASFFLLLFLLGLVCLFRKRRERFRRMAELEEWEEVGPASALGTPGLVAAGAGATTEMGERERERGGLLPYRDSEETANTTRNLGIVGAAPRMSESTRPTTTTESGAEADESAGGDGSRNTRSSTRSSPPRGFGGGGGNGGGGGGWSTRDGRSFDTESPELREEDLFYSLPHRRETPDRPRTVAAGATMPYTAEESHDDADDDMEETTPRLPRFLGFNRPLSWGPRPPRLSDSEHTRRSTSTSMTTGEDSTGLTAASTAPTETSWLVDPGHGHKASDPPTRRFSPIPGSPPGTAGGTATTDADDEFVSANESLEPSPPRGGPMGALLGGLGGFFAGRAMAGSSKTRTTSRLLRPGSSRPVTASAVGLHDSPTLGYPKRPGSDDDAARPSLDADDGSSSDPETNESTAFLRRNASPKARWSRGTLGQRIGSITGELGQQGSRQSASANHSHSQSQPSSRNSRDSRRAASEGASAELGRMTSRSTRQFSSSGHESSQHTASSSGHHSSQSQRSVRRPKETPTPPPTFDLPTLPKMSADDY